MCVAGKLCPAKAPALIRHSDSFFLPPAEFLVDGGEEALVAKADEAHFEVFAAQSYLGATGEVLAARVHAEAELLRRGMRDKAQGGAVGHDDGAQGEVVHPNGGDDEAAAVGREDGAATAEGVGSGACGGGDDDAVAGIGGHKVVGDKKVSAQQGCIVEAVKADFVEGEGGEGVGAPVCLDMEEGAGLEGVAPGKEVGSEGVKGVAPGGGEESKVAKVDSKHGDVAPGKQVDGAEQGAVAPDGEEEVVVALGQGVGYSVGFDSAAVQYVDQAVYLLAQVVFNMAYV